ncbi:MAG: prephenate dehydratase [Syntrophus sp. (in: bacteria)]|nr:prephenate dehydratase [Syntrophus sp. (in: bacteria)]
MTDQSLDRLRAKVSAADRKIVKLLNARADLSRAIGRIKAEEGLEIYDPVQEAAVYDGLATANQGKLPEGALMAIYREILSASRALQSPVTAACLGPEASFSHLAARSHFGAGTAFLMQKTIYQVFDAVERGKAQWGVVPVENSLEGAVNLTLDRLIATPLRIRGEILLRIGYCLLSAGQDVARIRRVYSHPQALAQCQSWLRIHLPQAELIETQSTAAAAALMPGTPDGAAVGSRMAAEVYGLNVLEESIEDHASNTTRFLIMGTGTGRRTGADKTSLIFGTPDAPGALYRTLRPFAERGINLLKIASYPARDSGRGLSPSWEYLFFADVDGHEGDENISACLKDLEASTSFMKLLGAYPRGRAVL